MNRVLNLVLGIVLLVIAVLTVVFMFINPPTAIWSAWFKGFAVGLDIVASLMNFMAYFLGEDDEY